MWQFINVPTRLPPCLLLTALVFGATGSARAQDRYRVLQQENFRREPRPSARLLAQVRQGSELVGGETRDGWVEITLEGWIWAQSIRANDNGAFDYEVSAARGENLRVGPNADVIARLGQGFLLETLEPGAQWVRVRRRGWMWGPSLERITDTPSGAATSVPDPPPTATQSSSPPAGNVMMDAYSVTSTRTPIYRTPGGDSTGVLQGTTPVRLLERQGEWVRVRIETWVPESAIRPTSPDVLVGVSGAEVRARPQEFEGKVVQWVVQYIALRTADDLRAELPAGRRYMLVRGPIPEAGFAYVLLSDEQADRVEEVAPLAQLVLDARVLVSRSRYLSNTVMELVDFSVRNP